MLPNFKQKLESLLSYLDQHKELDWYTVNIAAKKKKLAKDIVEFDHYTLWHAYYFPIRGVGLVWSLKGAEQFVQLGKIMTVPVDIFFQSWLSKTGKGLGVWQPFVQPAGLDSDILGTVALKVSNGSNLRIEVLLMDLRNRSVCGVIAFMQLNI